MKRGRTLAAVDAPAEVDRASGADARTGARAPDVVLVFVRDGREFDAAIRRMLPHVGAEAIFWVAYPKLTSPLGGDLNRDVVCRVAPGYGLATASQIAVDADWPALRPKRISGQEKGARAGGPQGAGSERASA